MSIRVGDRVLAGSLPVGSDTYTKTEINDLLIAAQSGLDNKVSKAGDTISGNLTHSNSTFAIFLDEDGEGYGIRSAKYNGKTQLRIYKYSGTDTGTGLYIDGNDGSKPYYYDGQGHAARLLNTDDVHITSTYINGTSWYRIWSDGWCEQGGRGSLKERASTAFSLLIPFKDTNYFISASQYNVSTTEDSEMGIGCAPTSTTTFNAFCHYINPNTMQFMWHACGYAH